MAHFNYLSPELQAELKKTAEAIVAPGKGILAADESEGELHRSFRDPARTDSVGFWFRLPIEIL